MDLYLYFHSSLIYIALHGHLCHQRRGVCCFGSLKWPNCHWFWIRWTAFYPRRLSATVSQSDFTGKMSSVVDRQRGRQWRKGDDREDKLTSCCWSVCPVRHSCNFPAAYWSGATGPHRSHLRSPRQSFHQMDPGPRRQCCVSARHKHAMRLNQGLPWSWISHYMQDFRGHTTVGIQ